MTLFQAVVIGIIVWLGGFIYLDRICTAFENCANKKQPTIIETSEKTSFVNLDPDKE